MQLITSYYVHRRLYLISGNMIPRILFIKSWTDVNEMFVTKEDFICYGNVVFNAQMVYFVYHLIFTFSESW